MMKEYPNERWEPSVEVDAWKNTTKSYHGGRYCPLGSGCRQRWEGGKGGGGLRPEGIVRCSLFAGFLSSRLKTSARLT